MNRVHSTYGIEFLSFHYLSFFTKSSNTCCLLYIMLIFMCCWNWVAVTIVKYECDSKNLIGTFAKLKRHRKSTEQNYGKPHPGPLCHVYRVVGQIVSRAHCCRVNIRVWFQLSQIYWQFIMCAWLPTEKFWFCHKNNPWFMSLYFL